MTIENFSIEYDAINGRNTFTQGDTINGRIVLQVSKETKVQSLVFEGKGKAKVSWTEHHGQHHGAHHHGVHHGPQHGHSDHYWAEEKYYDVKQHILREARQDGTEVISKGRHAFPFSFKIPDRKMPSTFKSSTGKIVHKLKAELKQSMKLTKKSQVHFTFESKTDMDIPGLMEPQYGSKDKSLKLFGSGTVSMDVRTKRMGYKQGEDLKVTVEVVNNSSREVKPKFILYEKKSYFAQGHRRLQTKDIIKDKMEAIESSHTETVTKVISIPKELPLSIVNCSIIKLEYRLKIYLDIKATSDPEVKLPIIILPHASDQKHVQQPAAATYGFEAFGYSNPPTWGGTQQPLYPPPAYQFATAPTMSYPDKGDKYDKNDQCDKHSSLM